MFYVKYSKNKINTSATLSLSAFMWLKGEAKNKAISKSQLIERGIELLKDASDEEAERNMIINSGIDAMLKAGDDQEELADPIGDKRFEEELL